MNDRNINQFIDNTLFANLAKTVWVYLKSSNSKGVNYDPYNNVGYTKTNQAPQPVKALVRQIQGNSLIARELGLVHTGAIEIVVKEKDVNLFKICQKIKYKDLEYSPFNKALGNRIQIFETEFGLYRIILFKSGN